MSRNLCEICDNDEFENLDGFYYCTQCGTKSLVIVFHSSLISDLELQIDTFKDKARYSNTR